MNLPPPEAPTRLVLLPRNFASCLGVFTYMCARVHRRISVLPGQTRVCLGLGITKVTFGDTGWIAQRLLLSVNRIMIEVTP
jgi:hypothetical protein